MNLQDNWEILFSSKRFGKFAGNFKFLKSSKLSSISPRQPLTTVKIAMNLQDNWKTLFSSFGKFAGNFKILVISNYPPTLHDNFHDCPKTFWLL